MRISANIRTARFILLCGLFILVHSQAFALTTAGWIEKARLYPQAITLHAKLDTGAKTTSINAVDPEFFTRDDERWVRFDITNRDDKSTTIEAPVIRESTIRRHFGNKQVRPVILLDICIGNVRKKEEVNLVDRSEFDYQLLIGRNFLKGSFAIDSAATYSLSLDCPD